MKKAFLILAAIVVLVVALLALLSESKPDLGYHRQTDPDPTMNIWTESWGIVPANQIIVMAEDRPGLAIDVALALPHGTLIGEIASLGVYQFTFDGVNEEDLRAAIAAVKAVKGVEDAFPNPMVQVQTEALQNPMCPETFTDPVYAGDNGKPYRMIGVERAWQVLELLDVDVSPVRVGVLDTALMTEDPGGRLNNEFETVRLEHLARDRASDYAMDGSGAIENGGFHHANGVLGLIAADHGDGGISGIASPLGRRLEVVHTNIFRDGSDQPPATEETPADAVLAAGGQTYMIRTLVDMMEQVEAGATIINGSYGPLVVSEDNAPVARLYSRFYERMADEHPNVLFVFAAGNEATALTGTNSFPGGTPHSNVITVGNIMNNGRAAASSNTQGQGGEVTLAAPGEQSVWGEGLNGIENDNGGTSSAAPMVTAAAALVRAVNPDLTAEEIKDILVATAGEGPSALGGRMLRVDRAVLEAYNRAQETQNGFLDFLLGSETPTLVMGDVDRLCAGASLDDVLRDAMEREVPKPPREVSAPAPEPAPARQNSPSAPTPAPASAPAPTPAAIAPSPPPKPAATYAVWEGTNANVGVNVTTTEKFQSSELAKGYSGGGVSDTLILEKQLLQGGFASKSEAMTWICSALVNIRYAKFAGMVADYQGRRVLLGNVSCQ